MISERSEALSGFSVFSALLDVAARQDRPDLQPGFHAEMVHLLEGLQGKACLGPLAEDPSGEDPGSAAQRSVALDALWTSAASWMERYEDGLSPEAVARRSVRRAEVLAALGGDEADWADWQWHAAHVIAGLDSLDRAVALRADEREGVRRATAEGMPFAVTPYYASLFDEVADSGRDRALRAQVLPSCQCASAWGEHMRDGGPGAMDFMREGETSPIPLVTRRYPAVAILKPYRSCSQFCVYCQRNWEVTGPGSCEALAPWEQIEAACDWIAAHPAIQELLITGGDPLAMPDDALARILRRVRGIASLNVVRIGTRIPVTLPMRITHSLADLLGSLRSPGHREILLVTHVQHPYEVTPEMVAAIARLRSRGIGIYNQVVYTFYASRRFETARLRMLLRRVGVDPYYTFAPKGKAETLDYRVPIARILQEQKEEARLLPGTRRTDEAVVNIPALGKVYLRAAQHRDLLAVLPNGSRVYEFHPWEKGIAPSQPYVSVDVPVLDYLARLESIGEDPAEYGSIWYYF